MINAKTPTEYTLVSLAALYGYSTAPVSLPDGSTPTASTSLNATLPLIPAYTSPSPTLLAESEAISISTERAEAGLNPNLPFEELNPKPRLE